MSHTIEQLATIEASQADFESFYKLGNIEGCRAVIQNLGDLGYETEAMFLHRALNLRLSLETTEDVDPNTEEAGGDMRDYFDEQGR